MRYRKFAILIFSILLAGVAFWSYKVNEWGTDMPLTAVIISEDHTEEITCWKDEWNTYYFFLPSYADLSMVQLRTHTSDELWVGDYLITNGFPCDQFRLNELYGMARIGRVNQEDSVIVFVQSGNLPTMYIDVVSGSMEYIHQKKGNEETGTMRLFTVDGDLINCENVESIKGRGNATWEMDKKAYSLTLSDQADLLGMGEAQRWILLANIYDTSNLKNKIAFDLAKSAGMAYSPDSQWVDLYLNGEYAGLYLLCERNEVHPERVDITPDNSFLISREGEARLISHKYPFVNLKYHKGYRIHHSSFELSKVAEMWQSVESALLSENGIDPRTGKHWMELIDMDSWIKKYLIDEVAANYDGGDISQFFYYDGEDLSGKIYAGPVWDMDITFGADFWEISPPNNFAAKRPIHFYETENSAFYILCQKEEFYKQMVETYRTTFRPLMIELVDSGLDRYAQQIAQAARANEIRWPMGSPEEETESIKMFLIERMLFLDSVWLKEEEFCDVLMFVDYQVTAWFAVRPGELLPDIPTYENSGWYVYGSDEPFDITQPVYESVNIYLKREQEPQNFVGMEVEMASFLVLLIILIAICVIDKIQNKRVEISGESAADSAVKKQS